MSRECRARRRDPHAHVGWKNGKRQFGKQRHRWKNNIKTDLK
jgi:hypothetical protein